jgi:hypothetical protein|tara:strand:+ start:416 stop:655 length:240 start_codon:yes stop_codon:yes gene_type:complete
MSRYSLMWILWPSFLLAGAGSATVFALIDPLDIVVFGSLHFSREVVYTAGFFLFWITTALSSALTLYMAPPQGADQLPD